MHFKTTDGKILTTVNPEYGEYLRRKFPWMSEDEIDNYMNQKIEEAEQEEKKAQGKIR